MLDVLGEGLPAVILLVEGFEADLFEVELVIFWLESEPATVVFFEEIIGLLVRALVCEWAFKQ